MDRRDVSIHSHRIERTDAPQHIIDDIAMTIRSGGVVVAPTETSYMLTGLASEPGVVERICALKNRPADKPLPVIIGSIEVAHEQLEWTPRAQRLAEKFWPGPLTIVIRRKSGFLEALPAPGGTLALRIPGLAFARELAKACGGPIVSTSANVSGDAPCYSIDDLPNSFVSRMDGMVNAGTLPQQTASTIVKLDGDDVQVLRPGPIDEATIHEALCIDQ